MAPTFCSASTDRRLAEYSLGGHWQPREKNPQLVAHVWPRSILFMLMDSGDLVTIGGSNHAAKRRAVQLVNSASEQVPEIGKALVS